MINPGRYFVRAYDASYRHGGQQHYREISIVIANPTTITKQTPTVRPTPRTNDFPEGSSAILIIVAISIVVVISFLIMRKRCNVSREDTSSGISPVTPSQPSVLPTPPSSPNVADLPERFLPHIDRLIQSQPKPLESLDKFYAYLELEGFTLTPELKDLIRKKIESILDEKEKDMKKQQISAELFGTPAAINPPLAPQPASGSQVIPLPTVPPGSTCQVCLSEFSSAEPGAVKCPHCGNLFHYRCIAKWINKNGTCPVCKKELKA